MQPALKISDIFLLVSIHQSQLHLFSLASQTMIIALTKHPIKTYINIQNMQFKKFTQVIHISYVYF